MNAVGLLHALLTAFRTIAGMMDLPESAWAAVLETHNAEACSSDLDQVHHHPLERFLNVAASSYKDVGLRLGVVE